MQLLFPYLQIVCMHLIYNNQYKLELMLLIVLQTVAFNSIIYIL